MANKGNRFDEVVRYWTEYVPNQTIQIFIFFSFEWNFDCLMEMEPNTVSKSKATLFNCRSNVKSVREQNHLEQRKPQEPPKSHLALPVYEERFERKKTAWMSSLSVLHHYVWCVYVNMYVCMASHVSYFNSIVPYTLHYVRISITNAVFYKIIRSIKCDNCQTAVHFVLECTHNFRQWFQWYDSNDSCLSS